MAKGWSIDDYNRQIFGQKVRACRLTLGWSHGYLAQQSGINRGTLHHVEKGEVHLPDAKRQKIIDVLIEALQQSGQSANRQEFLKLADLPTTSTVLSTVSSTPQPLDVEIPKASGKEKLLHDKPHEEYAELLNQQQEWQLAGTYWLLAAQEAKHAGDWAKWSRCLLHAGLMALTCGQFEIAERRFKEVIGKSQDEVAPLAETEAFVRLGWLYYAQDQFSQARQALLRSRTLLQNVANKNQGSLHFSEHGSMLVHEGREVIKALESTRLHWLGRTYVDWGIEQDNQRLIREGLARLQKGGDYDSQLGLYGNVGFALLRQIPALQHVGELDTAENYLARSQELLGMRGTARGHIYLHKGQLALEEEPKKAKDFLESAREGFIEPSVYSHGLARVFKEMSGVYLMDEKKTGDEMAFQYALMAAVLYPYGRNVELLQQVAHQMYWRMGENKAAFNTLWQGLEEKLWRMDAEPFSDLRYFVKSFQDNGIAHVEAAIVKARKAIQHELFRK